MLQMEARDLVPEEVVVLETMGTVIDKCQSQVEVIRRFPGSGSAVSRGRMRRTRAAGGALFGGKPALILFDELSV